MKDYKSFVNMKHIILIFSIILVSVTLNFCVKDQTALTTTTYLYVFYALVPLLLIFLFTLKNGGVLTNKFNIYLLICLFLFALSYTFIYSNLNGAVIIFLGYFLNIVLFLMFILGLAIFHNFFVNNIMKYGGTPQFVLSFVFFIPCLFNKFILSIKNDLITAPRLAYILLTLELLLITVYFLIKMLLNVKMVNDEVVIMKGTHLFGTKSVINLRNIFDARKKYDEDKGELLLEATPLKYAMSIWIQVNQTELNNTVFPILLYGDTNNPKPLITYQTDKNSGNKVLDIDLSGIKHGQSTKVKMNIELQKWNHIVFNYDGAIVDIFLNGLLYKTTNLSNNIPIHSLSDTITIGDNEYVLNGALADITYHTSPLSAYQILAKYRIGINTINL